MGVLFYNAMFEYPLIHPGKETLTNLYADTAIVGIAAAVGLRQTYLGTQNLRKQVVYNADGSYRRISPGGVKMLKGTFSLGLGLFLLYQGIAYAELTLLNRSDKVNHASLRRSPY